MKKPEIIAFYLPQFHPFPENDIWWGKGFTEWTNVGKARPLFKGHNQPRVPTELGYYDLRLPIVREQQVQLAREAGVTAFCYWHYWFGNGKRLIADIFDDVLNSGKPDFPFCLGWANHSWMAKNWNADGTTTEKILMEQTYPGINDARMHFNYLLKAFKDPRYLKIDGKPLLYIFDPNKLPKEYLDYFITWSKEEGYPGLFLVCQTESKYKNEFLSIGYSAVMYQRLGGISAQSRKKLMGNPILKHLRELNQKFKIHQKILRVKGLLTNRPPFVYDYKKIYSGLINEHDYQNDVIPTLLPQWDHSPRSRRNGRIFINATPDIFYKHAKNALEAIKNKPENRQILFLKSWNEWGEGNMMEPDLTYGKGFIEALRKAVDEFQNS